MIYTSYFPNIKKLPDNIVPISISRKAPPGYTGIEFKKLAPSYELLSHWKEHHDEEYYTKTFTQEVLKKLSPIGLLSELSTLADGKDICLICYEKPESFCHRHLIAKWLRGCGFDCIEWQEFPELQIGDFITICNNTEMRYFLTDEFEQFDGIVHPDEDYEFKERYITEVWRQTSDSTFEKIFKRYK